MIILLIVFHPIHILSVLIKFHSNYMKIFLIVSQKIWNWCSDRKDGTNGLFNWRSIHSCGFLWKHIYLF